MIRLRPPTRWIVPALLVLFMLSLAYLCWLLVVFRHHGEKVRTLMSMRQLSMMVLEAGPDRVSPRELRARAAEWDIEEDLVDDWGRPLELEVVRRSPWTVRIRSLGRDGRRGACCRRWVSSIDDDVVLDVQEDGETTWQQLWE